MNKKAILVGIQLPGMDTETLDSSLEELKRLVQTLGFEVIGTVTQKRQAPSPATAIGSGKLKELAQWTGGTGKVAIHKKTTGKNKEEKAEENEEDFDLLEISAEEDSEEIEETFDGPEEDINPLFGQATKVIFDQELTPNQIKHLEEATGAEILDRTGVIVEIFHRHAKTREAQLQVEIARLKYLSPRIRATGAGERQGGGIGSKGVGETAHELDRRRIRDRVAELQLELDHIREDDSHRRARRHEQLRIALVGYTNAGKSSLMRALTGNEVLVADKLFATLDTTVRALQPDEFPRILVSDTVGFIKKLPHDLVASFRSTLEEAKEASLLLFVVDASDPAFRSQLEVTQTVLGEIGAAEIDSLLILNKVDQIDVVQTHLLAREFPKALQLSTRNPNDIASLTQIIRNKLTSSLEETSVLVPYDDKHGLIGEIRRNAMVVQENFEESGVRMKIKSYGPFLTKLKKILQST